MIRLSRTGKKKYATYRIVIQDKTKDPWGKALELLGNYNPHTKALEVKKDRVEYWLSVGAQMSATINNLLISKGIIEGKKMKAAKLNKKKNIAKKEEAKKAGEEKTEKAKPESEIKPEETKIEEPKAEEVKEELKTEELKKESKPEEKKEETPAKETK